MNGVGWSEELQEREGIPTRRGKRLGEREGWNGLRRGSTSKRREREMEWVRE